MEKNNKFGKKKNENFEENSYKSNSKNQKKIEEQKWEGVFTEIEEKFKEKKFNEDKSQVLLWIEEEEQLLKYSIKHKEIINSIERIDLLSNIHGTASFFVSPDKKSLFTQGYDYLHQYDMESFKHIKKIKGHRGIMVVTYDQKYLITACNLNFT